MSMMTIKVYEVDRHGRTRVSSRSLRRPVSTAWWPSRAGRRAGVRPEAEVSPLETVEETSAYPACECDQCKAKQP
ncbi:MULTISPECIES: hypothetical protein [unclassified Streptomyces]|uniref:hypothetical protein n=1 Tax=unclassified Streptomyces TaxID=2593676 RepID=UPI003395BC5A